jgi:RNA recognition motif-containing protein
MEIHIMSAKLYVGNIPFQVTEGELNNLFSSCGTVINVTMPTDRETGRPRGFGFVEMASEEDAGKAISQLHGADLGGRELKVNAAVERSELPRRPYATEIGVGACIMCNTEANLYGFSGNDKGVCASCISSLSKASRSKKSYHNRY